MTCTATGHQPGVHISDQEQKEVKDMTSVLDHTTATGAADVLGCATTLGDLRPGDPIHIEIDMLARYVARLVETR